ncbi:hypothetical protein RhiirC2_791268 [Rhizophagus irregularis]|uniref:Uncharacterized protein n=1 Tax=Rhizophagus irregularis TaxID=588596 RepID=A0A2N1MJK9_9GLOM|nr:hypothetical protein RhiirC2_791268 [Rhizophagus irregularis]
MDLDSKAYSKLIHAHNSVGGSEEYIRIIVAILPLAERHDHETPEMWCSRIRDPFRKILEENPRILSKNGYITMYEKLYIDDRIHNHPTNYIYCSVFSYEAYLSAKATIAENTMPSAPKFEPACISVTSDNQEMISPTSYQSSNCKSDTGEIFISSRYAKQPKGTALRLRDGTLIMIV